MQDTPPPLPEGGGENPSGAAEAEAAATLVAAGNPPAPAKPPSAVVSISGDEAEDKDDDAERDEPEPASDSSESGEQDSVEMDRALKAFHAHQLVERTFAAMTETRTSFQYMELAVNSALRETVLLRRRVVKQEGEKVRPGSLHARAILLLLAEVFSVLTSGCLCRGSWRKNWNP